MEPATHPELTDNPGLQRSHPGYQGIYNRYVKRLIDLLLSPCLLVVALPIYAIIAAAILLEDGRPVFYRAPRGGYHGKTFQIYKFRTMVKNADSIGSGTTALNDPRITGIGGFLRKTKLDETANLLNILRGDMSFVGPRPELLRYTRQYQGKEKEILMVRPGVTDYSSLRFISLDEIVGAEHPDESYEKLVLKTKNELSIQYAESVSLKTDAHLILLTIGQVIKKIIQTLGARR